MVKNSQSDASNETLRRADKKLKGINEDEPLSNSWEGNAQAVDVAHRERQAMLKNKLSHILKTKERPASKGRVHKGRTGT